MKVLFVTHYPRLGGANQSLLHMVRLLKSRYGVDCIIVSPLYGDLIDAAAVEGIRVDVIRHVSWRGPRTGVRKYIYGVASLFVNMFSALKAAWKYRNEGIDIVHANTSLAFFGWCYAKVTRKPLVWHLRECGDAGDYCSLNFYYGERLSGHVYGMSSVLVAISDAVKAWYSRFVRPVSILETVYNGIDMDYAEFRMKEDDIETINLKGFKLGFVGGINHTKNPFAIVAALALLKMKGKLGDMHLYILGDGSNADRIELLEVAKNGDVEDRVHLFGFRKNIWPIISRMDVSIVPSVSEGFGRTAVEGMACGLPVIASRVGGLPEVISDGETGFLFDLNDTNALAEKISRLHDDTVLRRRMGAAAKERAMKLFSAQANADAIYRIYERVMRK